MSRRKLCLLIAGHNEEEVIGKTIASAIGSGMSPDDIYIVDDNSSDATSKIAKELLGPKNVLRVRRSGKGLALTKGARKFSLTKRYQWIHIADADGVFSPGYFKVFRRQLDDRYAAATGYIKSLPGSFVGSYRAVEYTVGMEIHRRFQSAIKTISVIPGPTSCFRADVFARVNFANKSLTEDFDVTLQLYRYRLGNIQFIPEAIAYTQDPMRVKDFVKQITRWNRGILQSTIKHGIGTRASRIDGYLTYQIVQNLLFFANYAFWVPYLTYKLQTPGIVAGAFVFDVFVTFLISLFVTVRTKRWDTVAAFPFIYVLRWIVLGVFMKAYLEVVILRRHRSSDGAWSNAKGRRYKIA